MSLQVSQSQTQYAIKKRKRPQARPKNDAPEAPAKSNPSKRHRDRLNTELERLSQLIPLPQDVVNKLDKLSILRLSVAYLRNKSYSQHMELESKNETMALLPVNKNHPQPTTELSDTELAMQALDGFIMVVTQDFNVFYITSSVQTCLGFPQSDVIYQSMLELIHTEDRKVFMKQMLLNPMGPGGEKIPDDGDPPETPDYVKHGLTPDVVSDLSRDGHLHRSFICRLRCLHDTSSGFLALHFTGHLGLVPGQNRREKDGSQIPPELGLFLLASPLQTPSILEIRTKNYIFRTRHRLDYTPLGIDQKGRIVLGYTEQELRQQSGYQFIHSADMMHCADAHTKLMKHGQSGLTVFRLLHRANRWQWVTASASLIFNKGVPEYIISTHRPITDQEGEEHLKKRSNAFRFDFTGHASLYAAVNPIGAGPPSSKGPSEPNPEMSKRPRIGGEEVDPATLYGAQSFQSMNNYPDGLPNVQPTHEPMPVQQPVKAEGQYGSDVGYFDTISPESFLSHDSPPLTNSSPYNGVTGSSNGGTSDSGYSDTDCQPSPGFNRILESLIETDTTPPLYHPPIPAIDTSQYENPAVNQQGNGYYEGGIPVQGDIRPAWSETPNQHVTPNYQTNMPPQIPPQIPPQNQGWRQEMRQPPVMNGIASNNHNPRMHNSHHLPSAQMQRHQPPVMTQQLEFNDQLYQQPRHHYQENQNHPYPAQQRHQAPLTYPEQQDRRHFPTGSATQNFMEQIHRSGHQNRYPDESTITAQPKHNASLLNSIEISSRISTDTNVQGQKELEDIVAMLGPDPGTVTKDKFQMSLECQEHTVQFDLHKIATEYQTANPMSVIQDYVQQNPTQAIALATGNMPDKRRMGGNGLSGHQPYQPRQQPMHPGPDQNLMRNDLYNKAYPQTQRLSHNLPSSAAPPNVKAELGPEDLDFDLEEFLKFEIPNIET